MNDKKQYAIVDTDNFGGDYPDEKFVGEGPWKFDTREEAQKRADALNCQGHEAPRFYKVVELPYELQPGFEP